MQLGIFAKTFAATGRGDYIFRNGWNGGWNGYIQRFETAFAEKPREASFSRTFIGDVQHAEREVGPVETADDFRGGAKPE